MNLNELIIESIKTTITDGKQKQQTAGQFGGPADPNIEDVNVEVKNKTSVEDAISGDIDKKNKNPQNKGRNSIIDQYPNLATAITAGVTAGVINVGAKIYKNPNVKFMSSVPATK